jgi:hypothetical protein
MKKRHAVHQTQWAAQFAVASELCRRDYQVALTLGNHPMIDLMVVSPKGTPFLVDVKGQYQEPNPWPLSLRKAGNELLFYVFAFVPDPKEGQPRFTVLRQDDVNRHLDDNTAKWRARKVERANKDDPMPCMDAKFVKQREGGWEQLPV